MENNYPSAFNTGCVKNIQCNTISSSCKNTSSKFINTESLRSKDVKIKKNKRSSKSGSKIYNSDNSQSLYCLPYSAPSNVIDSNLVDFEPTDSHSWSNQRGYGNIVVATYDTCNNIHGKVNPWNRIPKATNPYSSPADIKMAWAWNN